MTGTIDPSLAAAGLTARDAFTRATGGAMHRVIRIRATPGMVRAVVEDDFHHFRILLRHDGRAVTGMTSQALRAPYTLCQGAEVRLRLLEGVALTDDPTALARLLDAREQCTHQFDIAVLAIAMAARGEGTRRYHAVVNDPEDGRYRAMLTRDGASVLDWALEGTMILGPQPYAGRSTGSGFTAFVASELDGDQAEAALVLRRTVFIAAGRGMHDWLDLLPHAPASGGCWVQQPTRNTQGLRIRGSIQDFSDRAELLTSADDAWLAGGESQPGL